MENHGKATRRLRLLCKNMGKLKEKNSFKVSLHHDNMKLYSRDFIPISLISLNKNASFITVESKDIPNVVSNWRIMVEALFNNYEISITAGNTLF